MSEKDFLAEDYAYVAGLLRSALNGKKTMINALASNNLNVILSALDKAAGYEALCLKHKPRNL